MNEFSLSDLAAVTGGNRNNDGFGDGNGWWILLLFILLGGFNGNRGWGGNQGYGGVGGNELYPWLNQSEQINGGFRDQMLNGSIDGIQQSVNSLSTQLCQCCGDMQMALANGFNTVNLGMLQGFNGVEQSANTRQVANMQQAFSQQLATQQGFNGVQGQLADQTATILAENCADRAALSDGVRDIIQSQTANTQSILDKLCALELEGVKQQLAQAERENVSLQNQLNMANLNTSQVAQTSQIVDNIYSRLSSCPVGTTPVYGNTPIFSCSNGTCGCSGV